MNEKYPTEDKTAKRRASLANMAIVSSQDEILSQPKSKISETLQLPFKSFDETRKDDNQRKYESYSLGLFESSLNRPYFNSFEHTPRVKK